MSNSTQILRENREKANTNNSIFIELFLVEYIVLAPTYSSYRGCTPFGHNFRKLNSVSKGLARWVPTPSLTPQGAKKINNFIFLESECDGTRRAREIFQQKNICESSAQ